MESKTYAEIHNQYDALARTVDYLSSRADECTKFFKSGAFNQIVFIGSGSSYHISEAAAMSARLRLDMAATALTGGDLMLHPEQYSPLFMGKTLAVFLTRSGETSELINAAEYLRHTFADVAIAAVVCAENSDLAVKAELSLEIPWAFDESVCQTRSVTNLYVAVLMLIDIASGSNDVAGSCRQLSTYGVQFLKSIESIAEEVSSMPWTNAVLLSDGEGFGIACEAALAFNEISLTPAMCKHLLDVRHGPIVLVDSSTLVIARLDTERFEYQSDLVRDLIKRGALVITVSDVDLPSIEGVYKQLNLGCRLDTGVVNAIVLPVAQLLSYYRALALGKNPDNPEGLDAWIKL